MKHKNSHNTWTKIRGLANDVSKLLGHATSQMTQRYAHLEDASIRRATEQVAVQIGLTGTDG